MTPVRESTAPGSEAIPALNVGVVVSPLMKPKSSAASISLKSTESR